MKRAMIFFSIAASVLLIFITGCSLPSADKQAGNGADGAADGIVSRDVAQAPAVYEVRLNSLRSYYPSLAWNKTNNEYGIAWILSDEGVYFSRINAGGAKLINDVKIAGSSEYSDPSLVWNSKENEYGLVWYKMSDRDSSKIYFVRISSEGQKIGSIITVDKGEYCQHPYIAYNSTNNEYGVVWDKRSSGGDQQTYSIYFSRLDKDGNILTDGTIIEESYRIGSTNVWNQTAALVWNPDSKEYGITFTRHAAGGSEFYSFIYFVTRNRKGARDDDAVFMKLDDVGVNEPFSQLVWTPDTQQYNVVWFDSARIRGQLIDKNGNKVGSRITYPLWSDRALSYPFITWNSKDNQYGICWHTADHVRFMRADMDGQYISGSGKEVGDIYSSSSALVWNKTDDEYGICWFNTGGNEGTYFAHLDKNGSEQPQGIVTGAITGTMPGTYYIRNVEYGTYLSDAGALAGDCSLSLKAYDGKVNRRQKWQLKDSNGDGYYDIENDMTQRIITGYLSGGSLTDDLGMVSSSSTALHRWWIYCYDGEGAYMLRIQYDVGYRIYAVHETDVNLVTWSTTSKKTWQLVPAGY
jgi:hypothetical protein